MNLFYGNLQKTKLKKFSLYSLNTLSGVTSEQCPSPRLCARDHTSNVAAVANRWQRVRDLIGSRFKPHIPPVPEVKVYLPGGNLLTDVIQKENITLFSNKLSVTVTNKLIQYS